MEKILVVLSLIWVVGIICYGVGEIINGIRSKEAMSYTTTGIPQVGGYYTSTGTHTNTNIMAEAVHANGVLNLNGKGVVWRKPNGTEIDISKAAEIFWFFLARHPEIVEQFNAIEKIKES